MEIIYNEYYYVEVDENNTIVAIHSGDFEGAVKINATELQKIKLGKTRLDEIEYENLK